MDDTAEQTSQNAVERFVLAPANTAPRSTLVIDDRRDARVAQRGFVQSDLVGQHQHGYAPRPGPGRQR